MTPVYKDRRETQRFQLSIPCLVSCSEMGGSLFAVETESLNISRYGACLRIDMPLACGFSVNMDFIIKNNTRSERDYTVLHTTGMVIRSTQGSMAVRFDKPYSILNLRRRLYLLRLQEDWMRQFLDKPDTEEKTYQYSNLRYFQEKI